MPATIKVLVIGSGGREHALAWKLAQSPRVSEVFVAPGNAGTASEPKCRNAQVEPDDVEALLRLAEHEGVGFTVVGPELALAAGVVDAFRDRGFLIFGPTQAAAEIESSKAFTKDFMARHSIPSSPFAVFTAVAPALEYLEHHGAPIVVKADGLAAGKGVVVATTLEQARAAVIDMLGGQFGGAGARVVIEGFVAGEEASYIVVANGTDYVALATAQDHKRIFDADLGPNTGGMGAYSPAAVVTPEIDSRIRREVIEPTLAGMAADGRPYTGFLYAGLMIAPTGEVQVLEFNARLGDPETQPILMRLESDLLDLLTLAASGDPKGVEVRWNPEVALGVVLAAPGYPGTVRKGSTITGLSTANSTRAKVFHAGTQLKGAEVVTSGGRVLCVCGLGATTREAQVSAYAAASGIHWDGVQFRKDIGYRAIAREEMN